MKFSSLTDRVKGGAADAWDLHSLAKQAKERGEDVIVLSVGDPDFGTPKRVIDRASRAMHDGDTHYTSIVGHEELREAIAARHSKLSGQAVDTAQVITTSGAQNALFACSLCLLDAGDEAIVLQPMYVTYEATIQAPGATLSGRSPFQSVLPTLITSEPPSVLRTRVDNLTGLEFISA